MWEGPGSHALLEASQLLSFPGFHPLSLNLESSPPTYLSGRTSLCYSLWLCKSPLKDGSILGLCRPLDPGSEAPYANPDQHAQNPTYPSRARFSIIFSRQIAPALPRDADEQIDLPFYLSLFSQEILLPIETDVQELGLLHKYYSFIQKNIYSVPSICFRIRVL